MKGTSTFYKTIFFSLLISGMVVLNTGCKKVLEVPAPSNATTIALAFRDSTSANSTVLGIYVRMVFNSNFEWGGITRNAGKSADELHLVAGADIFELNKLTNTGTLTADPVRDMWKAAYATIDQINACIEGLNNSTGLNAGLKQQLLGECYFSRAFEYFYLVNLWGGATALVLTTNIKTNLVAPSTPVSDIYAQVIADLKLARQLMTTSYPSADRARPNSFAATALLARVYLYNQQYAEAITESSEVIASGLYTPLPPVESNFLKNSNETIWSLAPVDGAYVSTPDGATFIPFSSFSAPAYQLSPSLMQAFENGDRRLSAWVGSVTTNNGNHYNFPKKYNNGLFDRTGTEYYVMLRAAEQYLIRAEAYCRLNNIAAAVQDLNIVRSRAFRDPISGSIPSVALLTGNLTAPTCMAAVEQERRIELFAEWGHRWFDLKRWPALSAGKVSRADEVLSISKIAWQPFQQLYPVAALELQYDANLIQNPGY